MFLALLAATVSVSFAGGPVNLKSTEAKALLAKNSRAFLLDVRTPDEYRQVHLKGAVLIPLDQLERRVKEIPRERPIVVYCAVGARSNAAAGILASRGFREIYNVSDGVVGWFKNGYPVERSSR